VRRLASLQPRLVGVGHGDPLDERAAERIGGL
jgi:hypothetical protein